MATNTPPTVLDDSITYDIEELCRACKVKDDLVHDMINEGILTPLGDSPKSWKFSAVCVKKIQITIRLQEDLRVNLPGAALAIELLEELDELRSIAGGK
jgi:chaperone modulatory protein CbpM